MEILKQLFIVFLPLTQLVVSMTGIVGLPWITGQIISRLHIKNTETANAVEAQLRDALHKSALNAVNYTVSKFGLPTSGATSLSADMVKTAVDYVKTKNPDAIKKFGASDFDLEQIVVSKLPQVTAVVRGITGK